jgi:hypothetical protein
VSISDIEAPRPDASNSLWTFERFKVGDHIGTSIQTVNQETLDNWKKLYKRSGDSNELPYGIAQLVVMRAYTEVVTPRPPGNIHYAQRCELAVRPSIDAELSCSVKCDDKYMRSDRRVVEFLVTVSNMKSASHLYNATLTIYWAK